MTWRAGIPTLVLIASPLRLAADPAASPNPVAFARDIQPIFASRCYECHGEHKQKSGLRLDRKPSAFKGGDSGKPALVAGHSADSLLFRKITATDPDDVMPPKGGRLAAEQIARLKAWIDQGAVWPETVASENKHWAYVKPVRPALPAVRLAAWPKNSIDYFVLERLEQEHLQPSPEADRPTLLRRVSLDLIGLPPSLQELDEFLADHSPEACERVVDRLLASPRYGERWARPWLDLARYADTQGYEKDNRRSMWPWRDWVIHALNRNLPFDQFTIEQLAGDLLPSATRDQRVATGFHRNTMTNTEGGTDDEEFRHEAVVDRVNTTMSVWLGTTFGCAQCHNHKYDPFTMREYYQLYAFFNSTADSDKDDERPTLKLPTIDQEKRLASLRDEIAALDRKFATQTPEYDTLLARWEKDTKAAFAQWQPLEAAGLLSAGGATLTQQPDKSVLASGRNPGNDAYTLVAYTGVKKVTALWLEVLPDPSLPQKSLGRHPNGSFVLSRFEVSAAPVDRWQEARPLAFQQISADYTQPGHNVTNLIDGKPGPGWAVSAGEEKYRTAHAAFFTVSNTAAFAPGTLLTVTLRHSSQWSEANVGRFRVSVTAADPPAPAPLLPTAIAAILDLPPGQRSEKQRAALAAHWRSVAPELKPLRDDLARLRKEHDDLDGSLPVTAVMEELPKPRDTHLLIRGSFLSQGEQVQPGTPAILQPFPTNEPPNRLGLAHWLMDADNPLTARVTMNRLWEQYFGIGLVETSQDFGSQGEPPSHPKLLDWLATEFIARHWDLKAMHKLIAMSATYRQSSCVPPDLSQRDPSNRLLARGPRARLEAETVRDQALAVSGLLSPRLGGPPVMPLQPDGIWQIVYSGDKWETSRGDDKHRRGLYTFWRRTSPYPSMVTFDAPSREYCVLKRSRSNTPLQALTLLNDPVFVEAAQALARRLVRECSSSPGQKVAYGFRLCLARPPRQGEADRLVALYSQELARFQADAKAAEKMATSELGKVPEGVDLAELAAWTVVANVLLNLDELITKG